MDQTPNADLARLEQALRDHADAAYRVCLRSVNYNPDDAADAFQDACLRLIRHAPDLKQARSLRAWICAHMHRAAVDLVRRRSRSARQERSQAQQEADMDMPEQRLMQAEQAAVLRTALAGLPTDDRLAVELRYFEGLPDAEIAEALRCKVNTATQRIGRALERLRQALGRGAAAALVLSLLGDLARAEEGTGLPAELGRWLGQTFAAPPVQPMTGWEQFAEGALTMMKSPLAVVALLAVSAGAIGTYSAARSDRPGKQPQAPSVKMSPQPGKPEPRPPSVRDERPAPTETKAVPRRWLPPQVFRTNGGHHTSLALLAAAESVCLFYNDDVKVGEEETSTLCFARSVDGGASWGKSAPLAHEERWGDFSGILLGDTLHLVGVDNHDVWGNRISYLRLAATGAITKTSLLATADELAQQQAPCLAWADGRLLVLAGVHREPASAIADPLVRESADGGDSWTPPAWAKDKAGRMDVYAAFGADKAWGFFFCRDTDGLEPPESLPLRGAFVTADGKPRALRCAVIRGGVWTEAPVAMDWQLIDSARPDSAIPVGAGMAGESVYLVLRVFDAQGGHAYYFTRSDDSGRTWAKAVPLPESHAHDVSLHGARSAITCGFANRGKRLAVAYAMQGALRLAESEDGGATWVDRHCADGMKAEMVTAVAVSIKPGTGDLHVAAHAVLKDPQESACVLVRSYAGVDANPRRDDVPAEVREWFKDAPAPGALPAGQF